jgi:hypothetical protein
MPKNSMTDLRNHLFEVMEQLKDKEEPMDIERAKLAIEVGQVLVNSAKVEVDALKVLGGMSETGFFETRDEGPKHLPSISGGVGPKRLVG